MWVFVILAVIVAGYQAIQHYNVNAFPAIWQGRGSGSGREAGKIKGG